MLQYIWMCPDPIYVKYGKTTSERVKNIDKFVNSRDFKRCIKRFGGQVARKEVISKSLKIFKKIEVNQEIKEELKRTLIKIKKKLKGETQLAILTQTSKKRELDNIIKFILLHEWVHIFLNKNNIRFNSKKYWRYNEGLCTFCCEFSNNNLDKLEFMANKIKYPMEKQYYIYAIKFRNLLMNNRNPKERKQVLLNLIKKLK